MQTIDIKTTQNVTIEYGLASLRDRILALLIDLIIVSIVYSILTYIIALALYQELGDSSYLLYLIAGLFPIACFILYQLASEVLADGQSWGKKAMGIKVVRLDGQEPGLGDYVLRAIFYLVDFVLSFGIIGALFISSSNKRQRLGDVTANTTVIRLQQEMRFKLEDILKINTLENYEPIYPQVRQLSEQDMLLIKNVVVRQRTYPNEAHNEVLTQTVNKVSQLLDITNQPQSKVEFLKTLIRDYIVLTR